MYVQHQGLGLSPCNCVDMAEYQAPFGPVGPCVRRMVGVEGGLRSAVLLMRLAKYLQLNDVMCVLYPLH